MKSRYLVVYDYGMGGVWAIISARTVEEIERKYPQFTVRKARPEWMSDDYYETIAKNRSFDVDDEPSGWLLDVLREQHDSAP